MKFPTKAIHVGQEPEESTGAVIPPVYLTSTYAQEGPGQHKGYEYSRTGNPTRAALEANLAALEGGEHGLAFASGSAATHAVVGLLSSGDHVLAGNDIYGGTYRMLTKVFSRFGIETSFVDTTDPANIEKGIRSNTKLLWLETPTNPLLRLTDIAGAAKIARGKKILSVVDNTFATPYFQRPLELGADIVVQSTTKYLGGHSDIIGGAVLTRSKELRDRIAFLQNSAGGIPSPFECWLLLRGVKTLAVRMERHAANAAKIAGWLEEHPKVRRVYYPGLQSHPQHDLAKKQMSGFGGMISFELDGSIDDATRFVSSTKLFTLAESLGGVESLIELPSVMTHASIPKEEREKSGLADGLIRLSVGIEDADDLIADLDQAF